MVPLWVSYANLHFLLLMEQTLTDRLERRYPRHCPSAIHWWSISGSHRNWSWSWDVSLTTNALIRSDHLTHVRGTAINVSELREEAENARVAAGRLQNEISEAKQ